jgi:hypothetical protein
VRDQKVVFRKLKFRSGIVLDRILKVPTRFSGVVVMHQATHYPQCCLVNKMNWTGSEIKPQDTSLKPIAVDILSTHFGYLAVVSFRHA